MVQKGGKPGEGSRRAKPWMSLMDENRVMGASNRRSAAKQGALCGLMIASKGKRLVGCIEIAGYQFLHTSGGPSGMHVLRL